MVADIPMGTLLEQYPSAPLTLFSRFGVGSRDKLGFRPEQSLREVLTRFLVFDVDKVMATIVSTEDIYRTLRIEPEAAAALEGARWVDARGRDEFEMGALPGACYLDGELAGELLAAPRQKTVFYCRAGTFAGAAAQHFRAKGVEALALSGGLIAWSARVDPSFPLYGSDIVDRPGRLRILPLRLRARLPVGEMLPAGVRQLPLGEPLAGVSIWRQREYLIVQREVETGWLDFSRGFLSWVSENLDGVQWRSSRLDAARTEQRIRQLLEGPVQDQLKSHKGHVELVELVGDVARLQLGGGCHGCSSAALTVAEDIAAILMADLPELFGVEDASQHQEGLAPHH